MVNVDFKSYDSSQLACHVIFGLRRKIFLQEKMAAVVASTILLFLLLPILTVVVKFC